jgi:NADH-quinone oxidoreductase subunit F
MGLLSADELDTPLDFESLRKPGCLGLGTAAVTVMDDQTSMVDYLYNTQRFFAHESCGQCTPCREGTGWIYKTMKRIKAGGGADRGPRHHAPAGQQHGHHARHDHLRPGRRRRLADQERAGQVPPEFEDYIRTHQDPSYRVTPPAAGDRPRRHARAVDNTSLPILPGPPGLARPRSIQPA